VGKTITIECAECKKVFDKDEREYNQHVRKGRSHFFCGLSCRTAARNHLPRLRRFSIRTHAGNRRDAFTPFRWYLLRARARANKGPTDLTLEYLKTLWERQQGICPLTGWSLCLPEDTNGWIAGIVPEAASLDRIDSTLGYVQGNVRFIAVIANYARQTFSDGDVVRFAKAVVSRSG
jgi:hypothetical protein